MDFLNAGTYCTAIITAIAMYICNQSGYSFMSPQMQLVAGLTIIPVSLLLGTMKLKPYFLYFPLWVIGFIPFIIGLFGMGSWEALFWAIPMMLFCKLFLASAEKHREEKAIKVTHALLDVDPDELRQEIAENRSHHSTPQKPHSR